MLKPNLFSLAVVLTSIVIAAGQQYQQPKYLLSNPDLIKIDILPRMLELHEDPSNLLKPYKVGDKFYFRVQMTNGSGDPVSVYVGNPYGQSRLELLRDGEPVPYRKGLSELLKAKDQGPSERPLAYVVNLEPNESKILARFNLSDWYESLKEGNYELRLKHRFQLGQKWIESSSITFQVERNLTKPCS